MRNSTTECAVLSRSKSCSERYHHLFVGETVPASMIKISQSLHSDCQYSTLDQAGPPI